MPKNPFATDILPNDVNLERFPILAAFSNDCGADADCGHQFPDVLMLHVGGIIARIGDHHELSRNVGYLLGNTITVPLERLDRLVNVVHPSGALAPWSISARRRIRNLPKRGDLP
jgi:fumarylacetoacetate (FAA) hydrolase family protein